MEIGIVGAGSLGLLYAYYLSKQYKVTLYTNRQEQADQINSLGIRIVKGNFQDTAIVHATAIKTYTESLLIITVKQYHLDSIINELKTLSPRTIVFLQNGMGHIRRLASLLHHHVVVGIAEHGALKVEDHIVHHTGEGTTKLALYQNHEGLKCDIGELVNSQPHHFPIEFLTDWETMVKRKLIVNATINPLTAVLRVKNGDLMTNIYYKKLFYDLFEEVISILGMEGKEELWDHVSNICSKTAENESSMFRDIQQGRPTEIDSILGYLILNANEKNIPNVSFLYHAIKGIEGN